MQVLTECCRLVMGSLIALTIIAGFIKLFFDKRKYVFQHMIASSTNRMPESRSTQRVLRRKMGIGNTILMLKSNEEKSRKVTCLVFEL